MARSKRLNPDKGESHLLKELASLREELARLRQDAEPHERLQRLASFPEENPNPVIEMTLRGQTTYLNPAARVHFPDLWELGGAHPITSDLHFPLAVPATADDGRKDTEHEIQVGDAVYGRKVCYTADTDRDHIRIYVHDITRRKRAEESNQKLLKRLVHAHEEERHRVSRELHDEAGQALTALKLSLELIRAEIPADSKASLNDLEEAIHLADTTKEQIRLLAHGLRPPALDTLGLNLTLESFCRDFSKRTRLPIEYRGVEVSDLPDAANMCLYRVLQEALTNVARHSGAGQASVQLKRDAQRVSLIVDDDGDRLSRAAGPVIPPESRGIGIRGMCERLELFDGELAISRGPLGGLRVCAALPAGEST